MNDKFNNIFRIIIWINFLLTIQIDSKAQSSSLQNCYYNLCIEAYGNPEIFDRCLDSNFRFIYLDIEELKRSSVCKNVQAIILSTDKRKLNINDNFWLKFPNLKFLFIDEPQRNTRVQMLCSMENIKLEYLGMICNTREFKLITDKSFSSLKACSIAISSFVDSDIYQLFSLQSLTSMELLSIESDLVFDFSYIPRASCIQDFGLYGIKVKNEFLFKEMNCLRSIYYEDMSAEMKAYFESEKIRIGDVLKL